jgi:hypothetical protein
MAEFWITKDPVICIFQQSTFDSLDPPFYQGGDRLRAMLEGSFDFPMFQSELEKVSVLKQDSSSPPFT